MPEQQPARSRRRRLRGIVLRWLIILPAILAVFWVTGCMERLFYYPSGGPTPLPSGYAGVESVWFDSADGTRLYGWFVPARDGTETADAATIIHAHGNAGNLLDHFYFSEFFPPAGFNLFIFDYRGYGQSEGAARKREDLIADTEAALDAMLARGDVDPRRIGLFGHSLGGAIGLNVMADRPEIRAAVITASFTSWRQMAASALVHGDPGAVSSAVAGVFIRDHLRPIDAIARIDRPILIVHGDADPIVPIGHGRGLAAAGPTAELEVMPGGGHNDLRDTHRKAETVPIEFFRRHLADGSGPVEPMGEAASP
ncbi:MAG: alpha/beta fold hydrolase [Planctomycetota bacterium]|nr:alpha/beta fold hydrolase [Planctomycetota bacterium]